MSQLQQIVTGIDIGAVIFILIMILLVRNMDFVFWYLDGNSYRNRRPKFRRLW